MTLWAALVLNPRPLLLAHVMPWYEKDGWHWKMNAPLAPSRVASHFQPLIGAYDSAERKVVEHQVRLMKFAGFDGVIADWYGVHDWYDYRKIHARTELLLECAEREGLKICVMYEDQTIRNAIRENLAPPEKAIEYAASDGAGIAKWADRDSWLRLKGKKVVFVFGPQYLETDGWRRFLSAAGNLNLISEHKQVEAANGAFDWPAPADGLGFTRAYPTRSKAWGIKVACAFPRFKDFYRDGKAGDGYPEIADRDGRTMKETLSAAYASEPDAIQVATWNDWGEGTQVEPSKEVGLRDLVEIQRQVALQNPGLRFRRSDLEREMAKFQK